MPVLVLREKTERAEAEAASATPVIGTDSSRIVLETYRLLADPEDHDQMARAHNPYGDGRAAEWTADALLEIACDSD